MAVQVALFPSVTGLGAQLTLPPPGKLATVVTGTVSGRKVAVTVQFAVIALVTKGLVVEAAPQLLVLKPPKWKPLFAVAVQVDVEPPAMGESHEIVPEPTGLATPVTVNNGMSTLENAALRGGGMPVESMLVNATLAGAAAQA